MSTGNSLPKIPKWAPGSETSIARLSYRLEKLPSIFLLKGQILDSEENYVYPRKHRERAWKEVMMTEKYDAMRQVAVVNTRRPPRDHEDHLIIPCESISEEQKFNLLREIIELSATVPRHLDADDNMIRLKTKCSIFSVLLLGEDRALGLPIYQKGLELLLQPRIASLDGSGAAEYSKFHAMTIPSEVAKETVSIVPLAKGCKATESSSKSYNVRMRNQVSLNVPLKMLHLEFDLVAMAPTKTNVSDILFDVFGGEITAQNIKDLMPRLQNLLVGMWVKRDYPPHQNASEETIRTFHDPFQIRSIRSNRDVTYEKVDKIMEEYRPENFGLSWKQLSEQKGVDAYKHFEKTYSDETPVPHPFLPVAGDDTDAYFLLQKLVTCDDHQCFPNSDIFAPALKALASQLKLLEKSKEPLIKKLGKMAFDNIVEERQVGSTASNNTDYEDQPLLRCKDNGGQADEPSEYEAVDPIQFYL